VTSQTENAATKAAALIRQLRDFGQDVEGTAIVLDVNERLKSLAPTLRAEMTGTMELTLRVRDGIPRVLIDPAHLEGIVISLVVNAREAMPNGGTLTLSTEFDAARRLVRLIATDTGVGMSDATLSSRVRPVLHHARSRSGFWSRVVSGLPIGVAERRTDRGAKRCRNGNDVRHRAASRRRMMTTGVKLTCRLR
jgi:hypothetical protein